jgi:signal transduction histidine kinase
VGLILGGVGGEVPEKADGILQIADSNAHRLLQIINDMLDLEKMESGKMEMEMAPVRVLALIEDAIRENMPYAERFKVGFELGEVPADTTVWGNEESLMQVLVNLLSNAAKFSPPGSVVVLSADVLESGVQIAVTDHGAGVPPELQGIIFEKFSQVDSSDSRSKEGTGLGLSIAREIVRKHGGDLKLESTPGKGSRFYFDVPFAPPEENQEGELAVDGQPKSG